MLSPLDQKLIKSIRRHLHEVFWSSTEQKLKVSRSASLPLGDCATKPDCGDKLPWQRSYRYFNPPSRQWVSTERCLAININLLRTSSKILFINSKNNYMIYDYIFVTTNYGQKSMKKNKWQEHKIYVETQSEKNHGREAEDIQWKIQIVKRSHPKTPNRPNCLPH